MKHLDIMQALKKEIAAKSGLLANAARISIMFMSGKWLVVSD